MWVLFKDGFTFQSLGNHEFDDGISGLTPFIHSLKCPILCANINVSAEIDLEKETNLKKSIVLNIKGVPIGIVGYLTPDTKHLARPNRVEYEDEVVALQREVNTLLAKNISIIIALGHSGYETDKRIAKEVKGVDLVIGGHTNTFLWNGQKPDVEEVQGMYPTVMKQKSGRKVPVVQAYAYTKYLGELNLYFDKHGELVEFKGQPLLLNSSIPQEQDILDLLETYRPAINNMTKAVVGSTKVMLNNDICRLKECPLGNLIADAYIYSRASRVNFESGWTDAPIALQQGGGIRYSIDVNTMNGNISRSETIAILPWENNIVLAVMSGEVLLKAIEWSVYNYNILETPGAFLQYSGARVVYDLSKKPGSRVVSVVLRCGDCKVPKYKPLNKTATYSVLLPTFLVNGGDGYSMFQHDLISSEQIDINDEESFVEYLQARSPVYPEIEDRIVLLNVPTSSSISHLINPFILIISVFSLGYYNL